VGADRNGVAHGCEASAGNSAASSGGGDRQANYALYTIVLARLRWDTRTRAYIER
jgi:hypothetical protein